MNKIAQALAVGLVLAISGTCAPVHAAPTYVKIVDPPDCLNGCDPTTPGVIAQGFDGGLYTTMPSQVFGSGTVVGFPPGLPLQGAYSSGLPYLPDLCNIGALGGSVPQSGLTLGIDGSFYGAARNGGSGYGFIFRVTFSNPATAMTGPATAASCTVMHMFTGGMDGAYPLHAPVQGPDGNLYGATGTPGLPGSPSGVIYRLNPSTLLYTPLTVFGYPLWAPFIVGEDGNLYGVVDTGGTYGYGVVFQVTLGGQVTPLHNLNGAADGAAPRAPLLWARDGMLYGTTYSGGAGGQGVIFRQNPHLANAYSVVHPFSGADGFGSQSGLVQGSDGRLYGLAGSGGANGAGTLFVSDAAGNASVLFAFSPTMGTGPLVTPTLHTNGLIYGATSSGGTKGSKAYGVEFSYNAGLKPFALVVGSTRTFPANAIFGLIGQGFTHATAVAVGSGAANFNVVSDSYLQVTAPGGCHGQVVVSGPGINLGTPQVVTVGNASLTKYQVCSGLRLPNLPPPPQLH